MDSIKTVILCGGLGTRLREETEFRPKPMVQVGGMPILWHIMKGYAHHGMHDFVLCLGYKGEMIKEFFLNQEMTGRDFTIEFNTGRKVLHGARGIENWNVTLVDTGQNAMTGARIKRVEKYIDGNEFMMTYGDGLSDVDITALLAHHRQGGRIGTVTGVNSPSKFGLMKIGPDGMVTEFVEKPTLNDYINGGFGVFGRGVFDYLDDDDPCVFEACALSRLAKERQLSVYKHHGFWHCMDTYRDYLELNKMWDEGKRPWKVWE